ncbi:hypothetical protein [Pseudorhodobacter sp.]|uniref:hypothetical protein n=1 Tax=Pseudorhodobacter sp. TaxID=1934400 RepID=UPI0026488E7E|nr:hypothetical protein [Pseudorhodobacter sp.]MDN5787460.1 hypothetical protein [Pseudorhodobacter sp.]
MTGKKASRRLVLKGPDNEYAKRDALKAEKPDVTIAEQNPTALVVAQQADAPAKAENPLGPLPDIEPKKPASKPTSSAAKVNGAAIRISIQINLGENVSTRATEVAAKYALAVEDIIKAARLRAIKHFKLLIETGGSLGALAIEEGGLATRVATRFTGDLAAKISAQFDPLDLGFAASRLKPVITSLVQQQLREICDATC